MCCFQTCNLAVHLIIDGWTALLAISFLHIVIPWYNKGDIHHAVPELAK